MSDSDPMVPTAATGVALGAVPVLVMVSEVVDPGARPPGRESKTL